MNILDHPVIRNMERTGYPDGRESELPKCPECGAEAETFFRNKTGDVVGCDICLTAIPYFDIEI